MQIDKMLVTISWNLFVDIKSGFSEFSKLVYSVKMIRYVFMYFFHCPITENEIIENK